MNRAERRKKGIRQQPPVMKHITKESYDKMIRDTYLRGYQDAFDCASDLAVGYMLTVPLIVFHDHYKEIVRREWEGKSRYEHFFELCEQEFNKYNKNEGNQTILRLCEDLKKKTGFDVETVLYRKR